jgi:hypothetical protein
MFFFLFNDGKNLRVLNYMAISDCFFLLLSRVAVLCVCGCYDFFLIGPNGYLGFPLAIEHTYRHKQHTTRTA